MRRDTRMESYKNAKVFHKHAPMMRKAGWQIGPHHEERGRTVVTWYRDVPSTVPPNAHVPPQPRSGKRPLAIVGIILGVLLLFGIIGSLGNQSAKSTATATANVSGGSVVASNPETTPAATPAASAVASAKPGPTEKPSATPKPAPTEKPTATPKPTETPKPTATPLPSLNQVVSAKNWDITLTAVDKPGQTLTWSTFGNKTAASGTWLVVSLDATNTGKENFGLSYSDFTLFDGNGVKYRVTDDSGVRYGYSETKGASSVGAQVPPGVKVHYLLVFDINPEAKGLRLEFSQVNLGGTKAFSLGI